MPKKRIDEKTAKHAKIDKSIRIRKKFLGTSKCSGMYESNSTAVDFSDYLNIFRKQREISKRN